MQRGQGRLQQRGLLLGAGEREARGAAEQLASYDAARASSRCGHTKIGDGDRRGAAQLGADQRGGQRVEQQHAPRVAWQRHGQGRQRRNRYDNLAARCDDLRRAQRVAAAEAQRAHGAEQRPGAVACSTAREASPPIGGGAGRGGAADALQARAELPGADGGVGGEVADHLAQHKPLGLQQLGLAVEIAGRLMAVALAGKDGRLVVGHHEQGGAKASGALDIARQPVAHRPLGQMQGAAKLAAEQRHNHAQPPVVGALQGPLQAAQSGAAYAGAGHRLGPAQLQAHRVEAKLGDMLKLGAQGASVGLGPAA